MEEEIWRQIRLGRAIQATPTTLRRTSSANPHACRETLGSLDQVALALGLLFTCCRLAGEAIDFPASHLGGLALRSFAHGSYASFVGVGFLVPNLASTLQRSVHSPEQPADANADDGGRIGLRLDSVT